MKQAIAIQISVVIALTSMFLSGCRSTAEAQGPAGPPAVPVDVLTVEPQDVAIMADYAAQTYARNAVEVRARVEGYIDKWLFQPGAEVQAGQMLYVLDLRPFQASVEQAEGNVQQSEADVEFAQHQVALLQAQANLASAQANLVKARQDYERLKPLVAADAASQQDLDAAVAALTANQENVKAAQANVDQVTLSTRTQIASTKGKLQANEGALRTAELNLQYGTIRAPISGRIGDSLVPVGGLVTPTSTQPLTSIVPLDPIWVRFKVTESQYLSWAKRGERTPGGDLPIALILADGSQFPWKGHIEDTLNQVDPKTGTLELQARFPNPRHTLLPGQFGRVRVEVEDRTNAIAVPQKAVQQLQNMEMIYTVNSDNRVAAQAITTGPKVGELWVIDKGLKPGDRIIVEGLLKVRPGSKVQPMPYKAAAQAAGGDSGS
jgi:membrane fusion protein, multidrug efflux system